MFGRLLQEDRKIKWAFPHKAAVVSQVSAGVDSETATTGEKNNAKRQWSVSSLDSQFEAGWSRQGKGDSKSEMEER